MIRPWERKDSIKLRKLIHAFLVSQEKMGCDFFVCDENINTLLQVGLEQVSQGFPHLLYEEDGEILGYVQAGEPNHMLKLKSRTFEIFGLYVVPEKRHSFISVELFREMALRMIELGFMRGYSAVYIANRTMLKNMFYNPAIWPITVKLEWDFRHDPQFEENTVSFLRREA